jgi:formyltetrahydrofolate-dependent phosphoribosylglycinamide formyltransferase
LKNLVVFASGSGSNFQSIIDAISEEKLDAKIVGFISNNSSAYSIKRAQENDIPVLVASPSEFTSEKSYSLRILDQLKTWNADVLILAGYLKKIPSDIIASYKNNILNIHPSLLPKYGGKGFYGLKVHEAVIANCEAESGCTVHIVTEDYDKGLIIEQSIVKVLTTDSPSDLAKRVLRKEHELFPKAIKKHLLTQKK